MILHLLGESKFDSLIMNQMEECYPGENIFLLFSVNRSLNIFEPIYRDRILFQEDFPSIDFRNIDGIIIHYLSIAKAELLRSIPNNIPVACNIWGGDFYNFLPEFRQNLYSALTKKYLNHTRKRPRFYYILKDSILFPISHNYKLWEKAVEKSKIFSTVIPYEKSLVEKYFNSNSKYLNLPTYSLEKVLNTDNYESTILTKEKFQMKILIGNSGNPTNNHLEILHFVKSLNAENISVHLPLTYGDNDYIKHICKTGNYLLGKKFCPVLNHLNNTDFFNFINCFNIFIFNNYRQQGVGTIILALWSGGKIYLSNKNVTSSFYRDMGLKIFSIEDDLLLSDSTDLFNPLTREEILVNRNGLLKLYSNETVNNLIKCFTDSLKKININN